MLTNNVLFVNPVGLFIWLFNWN